jgi:hypothetical protein
MSTTREQRLERQALDDGDGDDRVYVAGHEADVYHERQGCGLASEAHETTREAAQRRWLAPCTFCCLGGGR